MPRSIVNLLEPERTVFQHASDHCLPTGFFFQPTIFTDVEDHMYIAKEESFGPIMIISRFADGYVIHPSPGLFSVCMES